MMEKQVMKAAITKQKNKTLAVQIVMVKKGLKKISVRIVWYFIDDFDSPTIFNIHY